MCQFGWKIVIRVILFKKLHINSTASNNSLFVFTWNKFWFEFFIFCGLDLFRWHNFNLDLFLFTFKYSSFDTSFRGTLLFLISIFPVTLSVLTIEMFKFSTFVLQIESLFHTYKSQSALWICNIFILIHTHTPECFWKLFSLEWYIYDTV
jgi:hypothetical protein